MTKPDDTTKLPAPLILALAMADGKENQGRFIEEMEANGQTQLVNSTSLPTKVNGGYRFKEKKREEIREEIMFRIMSGVLMKLWLELDPEEQKNTSMGEFFRERTRDQATLLPLMKQEMEEGGFDKMEAEVSEMECQKTEEAFRATGIKFGPADPKDPLFLEAELPPGWKKEASDHGMWSYVVDEKGRKRLAIFYKAAFYDRDAHIDLCPRFQVSYECDDWEKPRKDQFFYGVVTDGETEIYRTPEPFPEHEMPENADSETRMNHKYGTDLAREAAQKWAEENLPEGWDDLIEGWNVEVSL